MIALVADYSASPPETGGLLRTVRPGLLALKQFEPVYVLARWIRNFFMDILNRSEPRASGESRQPITPQSTSHTSAEIGTAYASPPMSTESLAADNPSFVFAGGEQEGELSPEAGGFWPAYMTSGVFSGGQASGMMEFPQPDSLQYQALYFLAGLGGANSE